MNRYDKRLTISNNHKLYLDKLINKNLNVIKHFETQKLSYPTQDQIARLNSRPHIWQSNDKLWRLSDIVYGDSTYWWVIAFYNKKATEFDIEVGETIYIPMPLDKVLMYMEG